MLPPDIPLTCCVPPNATPTWVSPPTLINLHAVPKTKRGEWSLIVLCVWRQDHKRPACRDFILFSVFSESLLQKFCPFHQICKKKPPRCLKLGFHLSFMFLIWINNYIVFILNTEVNYGPHFKFLTSIQVGVLSYHSCFRPTDVTKLSKCHFIGYNKF